MTMTQPSDDMTLREWSARIRDDLRSVDVLVYNDDEDWRTWAERTVSVTVALRGAPTTVGFSTWQDWGRRVIGVVGQ